MVPSTPTPDTPDTPDTPTYLQHQLNTYHGHPPPTHHTHPLRADPPTAFSASEDMEKDDKRHAATVKLPNEAPKNPSEWNPDHVREFLKINTDKYYLSTQNINLIFVNDVTGCIFPTLTEQTLVSWGLTPGGACTFLTLIDTLRDIKCTSKFTYGKDTKTLILIRPRMEYSEDLFRNEALKLFEFPEGTENPDLTLEIQQQDNKKFPIKLDKPSLQAAVGSGSITIIISTKQKPFSNWTFNEFKKQFGIEADDYGCLPGFSFPPAKLAHYPKGQAHLDDALKQLIKAVKVCPNIMTGGEHVRSLFIFEILKQVTSILDGFHVTPQKQISGSLGNGPVDYAVEYQNVLIMVTEAKKENIDQGVAQNVIQLDSAACVNRKRKRESKSEYVPQKLYGIVTTGHMWVFIRLEGKKVEVYHPALLINLSLGTEKQKDIVREEMKDLFEHILGVYQVAIDCAQVNDQ